MFFSPERAQALLPRIDPTRVRNGYPVGLRDGALMALLAVGVTPQEIVTLQTFAITLDRGALRIALPRYRAAWSVTLPPDLGARLLAWSTAIRLWGTDEPVFPGLENALQSTAIRQIAFRHRTPRANAQENAMSRPAAIINPLELLTWWEGRGGRRPASLRTIAKKLGTSAANVCRHLQDLRAAGQVDDTARARALAARGGPRPGGRPKTPLHDADLLAAWSRRPNVTATARHLHVSRTRVRQRLEELELLQQKSSTKA